jgi:hypothetical protein
MAKTRLIAHQPSWTIASDTIQLSLTQLGGHMAPVKFATNRKTPIAPYYINPWHGEIAKTGVPVLDPLRGDFFCLPFGGNGTEFKGEQHTPHGDTATRKWSLVSAGREGNVTSLVVKMRTKVRKGTVTKTLSLIDGHNVVYCRHDISGMTGKLPLGHHATLAVPEAEGAMLVSTSPFAYGQTAPEWDGTPDVGMYPSLARGEAFTSLSKVPLVWDKPATGDCSAFPVREGFTDLMGIWKKPSQTPAWMAAVNTESRYMWFSMKNAQLLPGTMFWIANKGRHPSPWNGRNRCLGLEDVCGNFAFGAAESVRANPISRAGFPTAVALDGEKVSIPYLQGAVPVPAGFGRVKTVKFESGKAVFVDTKGKRVTVKVDWTFVR